LKPDEVPATDTAASVVANGVGVGRFARLCTAITSGDTGGLAAKVFCARTVEGMRLLITAALAMMNTFVVENRRGRRAVTFSSLPRGTDVLNAGIIVGLLKPDSRRGVE
jgi:hypothetical protein